MIENKTFQSETLTSEENKYIDVFLQEQIDEDKINGNNKSTVITAIIVKKGEIFLALKPYHCEKVGYHGNDKRYGVITDTQIWSQADLRKLHLEFQLR